MKSTSLPIPLADLATGHGIALSFKDMAGVERKTSVETCLALLRANGTEIDHPDQAGDVLKAEQSINSDLPTVLVVEGLKPSSHALGASLGGWHIVFDHDTVPLDEQTHGPSIDGRIDLPPLPHGIHVLLVEKNGIGEHLTLISAPPTAPLMRKRVWGVTAALYGLPGDGMGRFGDLAQWGAAFGARGAAFFGINPVHALGFYEDAITSPYSPSHRGFLNTHNLNTGEQPDSPGSTLVDYQRVLHQNRARQYDAFEEFERSGIEADKHAFALWRDREDNAVTSFARFEALTQMYGGDSRLWPLSAWDHAIDEKTLRFHTYLQWQAEQQLIEAQRSALAGGLSLGLYLDLAVGARRGGAEDFLNRDVMATGVSIGAPGDHLAPEGQNWNLCGYAPYKLARDDYATFRALLRSIFAHAGMVRIDHVLGLARSFWIPDDGSPGGYIAHNFEAMLAIVALEADRANTVVVGEDLGLVPPGFREATAARGLYGYSALQYERDATGKISDGTTLRTQSLACFSTHDTPTVEGFRVGRDVDWWEKLDWVDREGAAAARKQRTADVAAIMGDEARPETGFQDAAHTALAQSPAQMVAVQLDDLLNHVEAQNLPGTTDQHPNWQRRYAMSVDGVADDPQVAKTAALMKAAGR